MELGTDNKYSTIKSTSSGGVTVLTPDILNCDEFLTFWVRWAFNYVAVGYGARPGTTQFMSLDQAETGQFVQAVGILNTPGHEMEYEVIDITGKDAC